MPDDDDVAAHLWSPRPRVDDRQRAESGPQVDAPAVAEGRYHLTRLRIERNQVLAADDEDPLLVALAPERDAAADAAARQPLVRLVGERLLDP
jgi:hypothetical protein